MYVCVGRISGCRGWVNGCFTHSFVLLRAYIQAQAAAQEGYDPKRGAALYQEQQGQLTAEGEPLPADFLGARALAPSRQGQMKRI